MSSESTIIQATMTADAGAFARFAGGPRCRLTRALILSAPVLRTGCFSSRWISNELCGTVRSESSMNTNYALNIGYMEILNSVYAGSTSRWTIKLQKRS